MCEHDHHDDSFEVPQNTSPTQSMNDAAIATIWDDHDNDKTQVCNYQICGIIKMRLSYGDITKAHGPRQNDNTCARKIRQTSDLPKIRTRDQIN